MKHYRRHAALILLILFAAACRARTPAVQPPVVEVVTAVVRETHVYKEWVGTVDGYTIVEIRPSVQGDLRSRLYDEGSFVRKGDPLFEVDSRQQQAELDRARQRLARCETVLAEARAGSANALPVDDTATRIQRAEADLESARAALEIAQLSLNATRIVSPIDGVAGASRATAGEFVSGETVLTTVSSIDPIKVLFYVGEEEYARLNHLSRGGLVRTSSHRRRERETLEIILSDGSVYPHRGDPMAVDRGVVTAGVFRNPEHLLRPGQRVRVRAALDVSDRALLIPQRAVFELDGQPRAAVVGPDGRVEYRSLRAGERIGSLRVIEQGLNPGERVAVEGMRELKPGTVVQPVPALADEPPAPV